jgi:hypothetical protein
MTAELWQLDPQRLPSPLREVFSKELHLWVGGWLRDRAFKAMLPRVQGERHLLLCVCDHFEPLHGRVHRDVALGRVRAWRDGLPELARSFRDSSGRAPRHTFFYPGEEYDPSLVEPLAQLVDEGLAEVEVHLHHDSDTRASLRERLLRTVRLLDTHGLVPRRAGSPAWSFVHGNWSLANGRRDGRWCGVDDELSLLYELGCYADFTFPSAPDPCQPSVVNSIYYARDASRRRAYERAEPARVGAATPRAVLLVQGPLAIARRPRSRALRIEGAALTASDPPTADRLATWVDQWVHVVGRPEWTFVKLHAHGAPENNARAMLGEPMAELHRALAELASRGTWRVHYVTAREMYNVARAAVDGKRGSPQGYFDYDVPPPARASHRSR